MLPCGELGVLPCDELGVLPCGELLCGELLCGELGVLSCGNTRVEVTAGAGRGISHA